MSELSIEYPRIYHNTNVLGLYGILKEESLWATHYKFLNDYTEIVLFKNKLISHLIPKTKDYIQSLVPNYEHAQKIISENGGIDNVVEYDVTTVVEEQYNALFKVLGAEVYITSFCAASQEDEYLKNNGLLSQWRGYGDDGGYAIEFDTQKLET